MVGGVLRMRTVSTCTQDRLKRLGVNLGGNDAMEHLVSFLPITLDEGGLPS